MARRKKFLEEFRVPVVLVPVPVTETPDLGPLVFACFFVLDEPCLVFSECFSDIMGQWYTARQDAGFCVGASGLQGLTEGGNQCP